LDHQELFLCQGDRAPVAGLAPRLCPSDASAAVPRLCPAVRDSLTVRARRHLPMRSPCACNFLSARCLLSVARPSTSVPRACARGLASRGLWVLRLGPRPMCTLLPKHTCSGGDIPDMPNTDVLQCGGDRLSMAICACKPVRDDVRRTQLPRPVRHVRAASGESWTGRRAGPCADGRRSGRGGGRLPGGTGS
jgi:hypothetical protein